MEAAVVEQLFWIKVHWFFQQQLPPPAVTQLGGCHFFGSSLIAALHSREKGGCVIEGIMVNDVKLRRKRWIITNNHVLRCSRCQLVVCKHVCLSSLCVHPPHASTYKCHVCMIRCVFRRGTNLHRETILWWDIHIRQHLTHITTITWPTTYHQTLYAF